jgi:uncharacterized RDD family membrane protein YckC
MSAVRPTNGEVEQATVATPAADPPATNSTRVVDVYAGVPSRLAAYLVDAIILSLVAFAIVVILGLILGPTVQFREPTDVLRARITVDHARALVDALVATAVGAAYFAVAWSRFGASPGQRLLGLRVRMTSGDRLTLRVGFVRWLLLGAPLSVLVVVADGTLPGLRPSLAFLAIAWNVVLLVSAARSPAKQGIHDRVAGTVVVAGAVPIQFVPAASDSAA